jgi:hypothetical protein
MGGKIFGDCVFYKDSLLRRYTYGQKRKEVMWPENLQDFYGWSPTKKTKNTKQV